MKIKNVIYDKYYNKENIDKFFTIINSFSLYLLNKHFKIFYPYWIEERIKEIIKLNEFFKHKRLKERFKRIEEEIKNFGKGGLKNETN